MPGPDLVQCPASCLVLLRPACNCAAPAAAWSRAVGTVPRGHRAGNVGSSDELGGGPRREAPSPDWNKVAVLAAQPGSIDLARCSSQRAGPAPGRLPGSPGVGTHWGVGLFMWSWGRQAYHPVRGGGQGVSGTSARGRAGGGGRAVDSESHSQPMLGSWRWDMTLLPSHCLKS